MSKKLFKNTLLEFEKYLEPRGKLTNVQKIIWFYIFNDSAIKTLVDAGTYKFPWSRHVAVAKKINDWAHGDLPKVYGLIWDIKLHFEEIKYNWTLDTAYLWIPKYMAGEIAHEHDIFSGQDQEDYERAKTKLYLRRYGGRLPVLTEEEYQKELEKLK